MPYRATSALHLAAQNGDVAALQRLLSEGAPVDLVSEIRYRGDYDDWDEDFEPWRCTALHVVCDAFESMSEVRPEHLECVKLLIAHGADPNAVDNWGRNSLIAAVDTGHIDAIRTLVEAGAVANSPIWTGSILRSAIFELAQLRQRGEEATEIISLLCKAGAPIDAVSDSHGTILEYAVWMYFPRLWSFFFRLGAAHPRQPELMPDPDLTVTHYRPIRAHPYFGKIEAAGSFRNYERAHLRSLSATFVPKFPRLPAEIVPLIVQFWAHVGDY